MVKTMSSKPETEPKIAFSLTNFDYKFSKVDHCVCVCDAYWFLYVLRGLQQSRKPITFFSRVAQQ
jgi:hypothetical protein